MHGEPTPFHTVLRVPEPPVSPVEERRTSRKYWVVKSGGNCQRLCADLGPDCVGFSYTRISQRCELFKSVHTLMRDMENKTEVSMAGTISGFTSCSNKAYPECTEGTQQLNSAGSQRNEVQS